MSKELETKKDKRRDFEFNIKEYNTNRNYRCRYGGNTTSIYIRNDQMSKELEILLAMVEQLREFKKIGSLKEVSVLQSKMFKKSMKLDEKEYRTYMEYKL